MITVAQERAVLAGTVALALLLVAAQGRALWIRLGDSSMPMAAAAATATTIAAETTGDLAAVMSFAPFGRAEGSAAAPVAADAPVDLTLLGITLSASAPASRAMIATADGTAHSLGIGQGLPSGATLVAVAADHVTIRAGDAEVALHFPTDRTAAPTALAPAAGGPDLANLIPAAAPVPVATSRSLLTGIKMAMGHDPAGYVAGLGLMPDAGGYRVGPDPDEALTGAGLQPGDVVRSVNGLSPGDAARDAAILDTVASAGTAVLQISRDGQSLTLTVPLE